MAASSLPNAGSASCFPDANRIELASFAAGQVESLATAMIHQMEDGPPPRQAILNLVAVRLRDLSHVILGALEDETEKYADLRKVANHGQVIVVGDDDETGESSEEARNED